MAFTLLIFLGFGLLFFVLYCERKSQTFVTFEQDANSILTNDRDLYIVFSTPDGKCWPESNGTFGAQYDGEFFNNTNHLFTDWTVTVQLPKNTG